MSEQLFRNTYRIPSARADWHGYDGGAYFVTVCTLSHCLGKIENDSMYLSEIGKIAAKNLQDVSSHYPYAEIPLFVIMPNHWHAIIHIDNDCTDAESDTGRDAINRVSATAQTGGITGKHNPMLNNNLGRIVRWIKGCTTHYSNCRDIPFQWQSRYYERIIRSVEEYNRIADYIENNVRNWQSDRYYE